MDPFEQHRLLVSRRAFLGRASNGIGALALGSLLGPELAKADPDAAGARRPKIEKWTGVINPLHFAPKAKRVIFLCMAGGPSHLETFDYKPRLEQMDGKPMPASFTRGQPIAQLQGRELLCLRPQFPFQRAGRSGQMMTTLFPHTARIADELCIVRSMVTEAINHDPAHTYMNTGTTISGRPSMGAWLTYGLGSEADDLPGFVVLSSEGGRNPQPISSRQWHNGFLPGRFQGVPFHSKGDPVHYVANPAGVDQKRQRDIVTTVQSVNNLSEHADADPELATRISQYEMAFRMQTSVPDLVDFSDEPASILEMYGTQGADGSFAANCLLARRLAERGVRFIHLYHRGWDHHGDLVRYMHTCCGLVDRATAALVTDLKQRGMLDETLIIWGGEFGRTPMGQGGKGATLGRDHHMKGFTMWLAGGGIKGGITYGATDDLGYNAVQNVVHVNDLHATMLYLFGIDHERLTYRYLGRDFRLTDVHGRVVKDILA